MIDLIARHVIPAALSALPDDMDTPAARAMLIAIGLQESRFLARRQNFGPARGFWQFEKAGIRAVGRHLASRDALEAALRVLRYEGLIGQTANLHATIENNDLLACVYARLLLWTLPGRLPEVHQVGLAWDQYLAAWRPGKPRPDTWREFYGEAWDRVTLAPSIGGMR